MAKVKITYQSSKSNIKGRIFEATLRNLLYKAGFSPNVFTDQLTKNQQSLRGRGATYDPDILGQFSLGIPFINPLLIIGEAKYYSGPIGLNKVREFLGSFIDLSQYSRINTKKGGDARYATLFSPKFTYCPIMFSAHGFLKSAEGLMFVHGINYISYENSKIIEKILSLIEDLLLTLKLTKFQKGDYVNLKSLESIKDLRRELKKFSFKSKLDNLNNYVQRVDSIIGVLDQKYPVHILYKKHVARDPQKQANIVFEKNVFILKSVSGRKYGEFTLSTVFLKEYIKFYQKVGKLDLVLKQIDIVINRKGRWELKQILINDDSRNTLLTEFSPKPKNTNTEPVNNVPQEVSR